LGVTYLFQEDTLEDTYVEYGQSFVDYIADTGTLVEPPFEEFSTQSIILNDGTSYALVAPDEVDPSSCTGGDETQTEPSEESESPGASPTVTDAPEPPPSGVFSIFTSDPTSMIGFFLLVFVATIATAM
jgi:hypothetical protein